MMIFKTVGGLRDSLDDSLWDKNGNRESSNIHQEMYELPTKNWTTVRRRKVVLRTSRKVLVVGTLVLGWHNSNGAILKTGGILLKG